MHEYVRLCVECNRHSWSCPVKRLWVSLVCPLRFVFVRLCLVERPSRAERARARPSGAEQARTAMSSAPAQPSGLELPFRAPQRSRAGSSGHFERPSGAERARAAISSAPAEPSGLEVGNVGRCGVFEPGRAETNRAVPAASKGPCGD